MALIGRYGLTECNLLTDTKRALYGASLLMMPILLSGCSTLPTSGPTKGAILHDRRDADLMGFRIIDVDSSSAVTAAAVTPSQPPAIAQLAADGSVDTVGPGDILSINIFEVGQGLFAGNSTTLGNDTGTGYNSQAGNAGMTGVVVDRDGRITLPYAGRITVAGLTTVQIEAKIQTALKGLSANPQALVAIRRNITNSVVVLGVVARPGRQELTLAHDHLLDAIAEAGGTGLQPQEDMVVRFTRKGRSVEQLLSTIKSGGADDLSLLPGDRIQVIRRPQSFTVFGATKVSQISFENPTLTLAEALARATGSADDRGDASAIFIFRYSRGADGVPIIPGSEGSAQPGVLPPTIYRINMMKPSSYFLAQNFVMRDKDVIYFANAQANRFSKLVGIINQVVSPVVTAKVLSQ